MDYKFERLNSLSSPKASYIDSWIGRLQVMYHSLGLSLGFALALSFAVATSAEAADLTIDSPENDRLVMSPTIDVAGKASPDGAQVRVIVNGVTSTTSVLGGKWTVASLRLNVGANMIEARTADKTASVLVVRGSDNVARRPQQKVRFLWNEGVDEEIKKIARLSLSARLTDNELASFADAVKSRTVEVFRGLYRGVADIAIAGADGNDVHTISMMDVDDTLFGQSPPDCGNLVAKQISEVHVGTYRRQMTANIDEWRPMQKSDPVAVRIEDAAQALGRTSAHEFGHSLGLVGGSGDRVCKWMDGCDGGHNCDDFDARNPRADRFKDGWHIMDPGGKTENNARLAEPDPTRRTTPRQPAIFEPFSASYLKIIHPLP